MKKPILWLCIGGALGLFFGMCVESAVFSVFDFAKLERKKGDRRYADILLTVACAHKLGYDGKIEELITPFGRGMVNSLLAKEAREELAEAGK